MDVAKDSLSHHWVEYDLARRMTCPQTNAQTAAVNLSTREPDAMPGSSCPRQSLRFELGEFCRPGQSTGPRSGTAKGPSSNYFAGLLSHQLFFSINTLTGAFGQSKVATMDR